MLRCMYLGAGNTRCQAYMQFCVFYSTCKDNAEKSPNVKSRIHVLLQNLICHSRFCSVDPSFYLWICIVTLEQIQIVHTEWITPTLTVNLNYRNYQVLLNRIIVKIEFVFTFLLFIYEKEYIFHCISV